MICESCAFEADGGVPKRADCWKCGKDVALVKGDGTHSLVWNKGPRYRYHKNGRHTPYCQGSGKTAVWGHAACKGCDCHHRPVKVADG